MSWALLVVLVGALGVAVLVTSLRRRELALLSRRLEERSRALETGTGAASLQYPHVDLTRCGGCGLCIEACPEEGVLELIHGQAVVVHGARCVGHGACARECPVGAIEVTLANLEERRDIPALGEDLEATGTPGLFLAGEVTGFALVKTALEHGSAVADVVAERVRERVSTPSTAEEPLDLCVVGAGPAGLACSLRAQEWGLRFLTIDRESIGGTVAKYPRRKLVMTQPVELPGHGRLTRTSYSKEELMELWEDTAASHGLPIHTGVEFQGAERASDGVFRVATSGGSLHARHVCLAIGRRGQPRRLGVPGEELPKVVYALIDAKGYVDRDVLVVGGGDSAVEAALALTARGRNRVTLSYRGSAFHRIKAANQQRLDEACRGARLQVITNSEVVSIAPAEVLLGIRDEEGAEPRLAKLPNDDVFVLAGGVPPFPLLEASGVSFDPADRPPVAQPTARGTGLRRGLAGAFVASLATAAWVFGHADYYRLEELARIDSPHHAWLRPAAGLGLLLGAGAAACMAANLCYLARRSLRIPFSLGSLRTWMNVHVVTGVLALLLALVHGGMTPGDSPGGHALAGLAVLLATGAVGRYFYAYVPRAANGRELELEEAKRDLARFSREWKSIHAEFGARAFAIVAGIVPEGHWRGTFAARVWSLLRGRARVRSAIERLRTEGRSHGVPREQLDTFQALADRAMRTLLAVSHYEDLRAILATWRWLHRWTALLVVLLVTIHVVTAIRYGSLLP